MKDTKTLILDAAERLLAERGFAAASLRSITKEAGVNLGAVNYHFRSKEALIQAVFARRLGPMNQQRLAALDRCESAANGGPVPVAELLKAFLSPVLRQDREIANFITLMGRMYGEPSLDVKRIFAEELGGLVKRFSRAFHRSLPDLDSRELFYRLFFTIGAMAQMLAAGALLEFISGGICDSKDRESTETMLLQFIGAGLSASPAPKRKGRAR
jgi:AcrR family transcriptional regulator